MKKIGLLLLICVLASSCVSSQRMMRSVPFGESKKQNLDSDRVNLWPALYHAGAMTSVLWPIMDFDDQGFAIRPLVVRNEDDWSFLFPLSGWNTKENNGWVGPAYWYQNGGKQYGGCFPVMHFGEDFSYAGPAWWDDDSFGIFPILKTGEGLNYAGPVWWKDGQGGLFPIAKFGGKFNYVGPGWWTDDKWGIFPVARVTDDFSYAGPVWWKDGQGGLFPIAKWGGDLNYAGPVWWSADGGGVFPVAKWGGDLNYAGPVWWKEGQGGVFPVAKWGGDLNYAGPVWWTENMGGVFPIAKFGGDLKYVGPVWWEDSDWWGVFPLIWHDDDITLAGNLWWHNHKNFGAWPFFAITEELTSHVGPVWWYDWEGFGVFPVANRFGDFWHVGPVWANTDSGSFGAWPLFWKTDDSTVLLPLYSRSKLSDEHTRRLFLLGLLGGSDHRGENDFTRWASPVWFHHRDGAEQTMFALPAFLYNTHAHGGMFVCPFGGRGWSGDGDTRVLNVMGPFYHHHEDPELDMSYTAVMWPFWGHKTQGEAGYQHLLPFYFRSWDEDYRMLVTPASVSWKNDGVHVQNILGPVFHHRRDLATGRHATFAMWPFFHSIGDDDSGSNALLPLYHYSRQEDGGRTFFTLLGGGAWNANSKRKVIDVLGPVFYHGSNEDASARTTSVMWPLWLHHAEPGRGSATSFPLFRYSWEDDNRYLFSLLGGGYRDTSTKAGVTDILGPVFYRRTNHDKTDTTTSVMWPLWVDHREPDGGYQLSFPFFFSAKENDERVFATLLGGGYWDKQSKASLVDILGPVFYRRSSEDGSEKTTSLMWPLWIDHSEPDGGYQLSFPFFFSAQENDERVFATLLGGGYWDKQSKASLIDILGPVFYHRSNEDASEKTTSVMWPLWIDHTDPDGGYTCAFPFFFHGEEDDENLFVTILGGAAWSDDNSRRTVNVLGPIMHYSRDDKADSQSLSLLWPLFHQSREGDTTKSMLLGVYGHESSTDHSDLYYLFGLGHYERQGKQSQWWLFPFANGSCKMADDGDSEKVAEKEFKLLFGALSNYRKTEKGSHFSILKYLFRRDREGDKITRDMFPGISYDSSPEASKFSFLWRVFNIERKDGKRSGHIFFVPWGKRT